jgi:hypothetical protein
MLAPAASDVELQSSGYPIPAQIASSIIKAQNLNPNASTNSQNRAPPPQYNGIIGRPIRATEQGSVGKQS